MSDEILEYGPDTTYCEWLAKTRWGAYINKIEERAIMLGHRSAPAQPGMALEIGCEGGRWSRLLTNLGWDMVCTDVNKSFLDICQRRLPQSRCVLVEPDQTFPCDDNSISLLLCVGVPPAIQSHRFIPECSRVLKQGGVVVGTFWNLNSVRGFALHLKALSAKTPDYYKFSYPSWRRTLARSGFQLLHEEGYCWFPFRRASESKLVPYAVAVERVLRLGRLAAASPWVAFAAKKV
jgi:SAM-dependent methyltransferase